MECGTCEAALRGVRCVWSVGHEEGGVGCVWCVGHVEGC